MAEAEAIEEIKPDYRVTMVVFDKRQVRKDGTMIRQYQLKSFKERERDEDI